VETIQDALRAWRAAERRIKECEGYIPFELQQEVVRAKQRYQEVAAQHTDEQIDAVHEAERRHVTAAHAAR
jgi:DNA-binding PadR family transcriptional regulator